MPACVCYETEVLPEVDEKREDGKGRPDRSDEVAERRVMDRVDFLKWAAGLSLGGTALLTSVAAAKAINPPERSIDGKTKMPPTALVTVADLKESKPRMFDYGDDAVWITKLPGDKIIALNAACPHVACKLPWVEATQQYACPCHASFFDINGTKLSGPALRNMDKAIFEVKGGQVVVSGFVTPA
jgi:nitrite reductase/ring-hydroxylating ferredoxin subunit